MQHCSPVPVTLGLSLSIPSAGVTGQLQHSVNVDSLTLVAFVVSIEQYEKMRAAQNVLQTKRQAVSLEESESVYPNQIGVGFQRIYQVMTLRNTQDTTNPALKPIADAQ